MAGLACLHHPFDDSIINLTLADHVSSLACAAGCCLAEKLGHRRLLASLLCFCLLGSAPSVPPDVALQQLLKLVLLGWVEGVNVAGQGSPATTVGMEDDLLACAEPALVVHCEVVDPLQVMHFCYRDALVELVEEGPGVIYLAISSAATLFLAAQGLVRDLTALLVTAVAVVDQGHLLGLSKEVLGVHHCFIIHLVTCSIIRHLLCSTSFTYCFV